MAYSIINPWRYGIGSDNVAKTLGYRWQEGDDSPGGWFTLSQNNEGAMQWSRFREGDNEGGEGTSRLPDFSDAFDPKEAQKQNDFLSKFIPALKTGRSDIWNAYMGGYGNEQEAIKNLYLDLGEYGGGYNLISESPSDGGASSFYDPTNRRLTKFLGGPADLFKQAANDPKHFGIVGGPGYLPYSYDEIASDPSSKLASLGLFLDDQGKPIIGGVRSTPNNNRQFLANFATMMPITLGSAFMGGALGGAFPGIDVATGAAMEAGTTGLSLSNALGLKDLPSWLSSGIDKLGNSLITQGVQGKNPLDNPVSLVSPFLKGLDFGNIFGGAGDADTFNTMADTGLEQLSNTFDGGNMGDDFWDFWGGFDDTGSNWDFGNSGSSWGSNISYDPSIDLDYDPYSQGLMDYKGSTDWGQLLGKFMPSGDTLVKLLAMGGGALLGSRDGSKQAGTTTSTTSNVPEWMIPYLQGGFNQGVGINASQSGNPLPMSLVNAGADQLGRTIRGDYTNLSTNPNAKDLLTNFADTYARGTAATTAGQFARAHALDSTAYDTTKAWNDQAFGRGVGGLIGQLYGNERTNQVRAASLAPDYASAYAHVPYANTKAYLDLMKGWGGSMSTPYYTNPTSGALGGILAAASLFK